MDFEDTPSEARFRAEVRSWLAENARDYVDPLPYAPGDRRLAELGRAWQRRKASGGYAAISWPKEAGGRGATPMEEVIFAEEEARFHVPVGIFVEIGIDLAVPTIRAHGTPEQIERYAHPTLLGDIFWCQLFSEPGAGSDLAAVRTRAVRDGDDWVVNGQKIWTSWGHTADWGILLARTDPDVVKHRGLTFFLVDMRTPGIEVRPIRSITGESEFNEVFLSDVRIPDAQRLGVVGGGWKVAMTTLLNERMMAFSESQSVPCVGALVKLIDASGKPRQRYAREVAALYAREQGLKYFRCRMLTALSRGKDLGPTSVINKLVYSHMLQDLSALGIDVLGLGQAYPPADGHTPRRFHYGYQWAAALRIAGGSDEILRNQIAERALGMPGDIRADRDLPFSQLPTGR
jgi:alkylation response protein AidB-like acyl-CoA dehydrogenase